MKKLWTEMIRQTFMPSQNFCGHPTEIGYAQKMLAMVFEEKVPYEDYCKAMDEWIENNAPSFGEDETLREEHISTQKKRVRSLESFFMN